MSNLRIDYKAFAICFAVRNGLRRSSCGNTTAALSTSDINTSKGGIVLWCFQNSHESHLLPVNDLIQNVMVPEKTFDLSRQYKQLMLKYKLDNEFELVFVLGYQSSIKLSYVDKLLSDVQRYFRDRFKNELQFKNYSSVFDFEKEFRQIQKAAEAEAFENEKNKKMRTYQDSEKSKKTVESMIIKPAKENEKPVKPKKPATESAAVTPPPTLSISPTKNGGQSSPTSPSDLSGSDSEQAASVIANREKFLERMTKKPAVAKEKPEPKKKGKAQRQWGLSDKAANMAVLDYSSPAPASGASANGGGGNAGVTDEDKKLVGTMGGELKDISQALNEKENEASDEELEEEEEEEEQTVVTNGPTSNGTPAGKKGGVWGLFDSLVGAASRAPLTQEAMAPALERLRDHLISKNVAAEVADRLCQSVGTRLEGKVLGSFQTTNAAVKAALNESCLQLLQPSRRIDLLGGALEAKRRSQEGLTVRPYVTVFCGVNGVGKSTNLAKICFWLMENRLRVLIAACDTFRSGAIEQLRTHVRRLSALHPPVGNKNCVEVFERGYGKDAAGVAMEAINYARSSGFDVVLVDTAGRMQDNRPLMVALSKLIHVNQPDLVLFVGEALVGNDGVDQLVKFQQALVDNAIGPSANMTSDQQAVDAPPPRSIDGVVLTKFDTIDDKVGAAISMTYTTGKPIVFVGTGQTYADLASLNADSVVRALMK